MNRTTGLFLRAALICTFVLALLPGSAAAQDQPPDVPPPPLTIVLPVPAAADLQVAAGLSRAQAQNFAEEITNRQARPLLEQLKRLQLAGAVESYTLNAGSSSIEVQAASEQGIEQVRAMAGTFSIFAGQKQASTCQQNSARALQSEVEMQSRLAEKRTSQAELRAATDGLSIVAFDGAYEDFIYGGAPINSTVSLSLSRAGQQLFNTNVWSDNEGFYSLSPARLDDCISANPYSWWLLPGDIITAKSGAKTTSITVDLLTAWADYDTQTVQGSSTPGKTINIFSVFDEGSCQVSVSSEWTAAGNDGSFAFDLSTTPFQRSAYFSLDTITDAGSGTEIWIDAMQLNAVAHTTSFFGTLHPDRPVTVTYSDSGGPVESWSGWTASDGSFDGRFMSSFPAPDDQLTATDGETTISLTIVIDAFHPRVDNHEITGTTAPYHNVYIEIAPRTFGRVMTGCPSNEIKYSCFSTTSDQNGNFRVELPSTGIFKGDQIYLAIYDGQGNAQINNQKNIPAVVADLSNHAITGYGALANNAVTISILNSSGNLKYGPYGTVASYDGGFTYYLPDAAVLNVGDKVEVTNGGQYETLIIGSLTGRLTKESKQLSGSTSGTNLIADLWDYRPNEASYYGKCDEKVNPVSFLLDYSSFSIGGGDWADLYSRTADGNYLSRYASTLSLYLDRYEGELDWLSGYTTEPDQSVTIRHLNSANQVLHVFDPLKSGRFNSYFQIQFPYELLNGEKVQIETGGVTRTIPIVALTAVRNGAANTVSGLGPASQIVWPTVFGSISPYQHQSYRLPVWTNSSGAYSASFANAHYQDCSQVRVGDACAVAGLSYYTADEQYVALVPEVPGAVQSDPAEAGAGDDEFSTAQPYLPAAVHTFEAGDDQDWVTFTVSPEQAGRLFTIQAVMAGSGMKVDFALWDASQQPVAVVSSSSARGTVLKAALDAGVYYLQATPLNDSMYGYCGSFYQILVADQYVFLPGVQR